MTDLIEFYKQDVITGNDTRVLDSGNTLTRRYLSVTFSIMKINTETRSLIIMVTQDANSREKHLTSGELLKRTVEYFDQSFRGWKLKAHVVPLCDRMVENYN